MVRGHYGSPAAETAGSGRGSRERDLHPAAPSVGLAATAALEHHHLEAVGSFALSLAAAFAAATARTEEQLVLEGQLIE